MKKLFLTLGLVLAALSLHARDTFAIVNGPYLQNVTGTEATVIWTTSGDALSWVEVAPDDGSNFYAGERPRFYDTHLGKKNIGRLHKVTITGLEEGTTYRYRIFSQQVTERKGAYVAYGKVVATDVFRGQPYSFCTADSTKPTASFAMVCDIHEDNELLSALIGQADMDDTDFVIFNGDMAGKLDSEEHMFGAYLQTASKLFAAETPVVYTRGNHETRGEFSHRFMDYYPTTTGLPYYTFRQGPVLFIVLDCGEDKPDNDMEYYGTAAYDRYREQEAEWLKGVTASREFREAPVKIALLHVPPANATWHGALHLQELMVPLLNGAGIDLMLCGHLHRHAFIPAGQEICNFPVLINSNKHVVLGKADADGISLTVKDAGGKTVKELRID